MQSHFSVEFSINIQPTILCTFSEWVIKGTCTHSSIVYHCIVIYWRVYCHWEKKEEIWLSLMTKAPTPAEMSKGQSDYTKNATKKFDYTAIVDRFTMWVGVTTPLPHPNWCGKPVYGPNLPSPRNSRVIKRTRIKIFCKCTSLYRQQTNSYTKRRGHNNRYTYSIGDKYYISKIYIATSE